VSDSVNLGGENTQDVNLLKSNELQMPESLYLMKIILKIVCNGSQKITRTKTL